jgi:methionyl-tRNA formyltransferase
MRIKAPKIIFLMTDENIHGREMILKFLEFNFPINTIIVEHKSKLAEKAKEYLKNNFYNPKPLNEICKDKNIKIHYVENHNEKECEQILMDCKPDYIILGGTRILKEHIINKAKYGVLNAHPALLPKYQGLDCVAWSILNKDQVGATVHIIDTGIDTGPIVLQESIDYSDCEKLIEVRIKLMKKCAELTIKSLIGLEMGSLKPIKQNLELGINHPAIPEKKLELVNKILQKEK